MSKKTYVDVETGQYFNLYPGDSLKIITQKQKEAVYNLNRAESFNKKLGGFVLFFFKYYDKILQEHPEITSEDITKIFYLATFLNYDGYLYNGIAHMNKKHLIELIQIAPSSFYKFYNKMINCGIFIEDQLGFVKLNTNYFLKGKIAHEDRNYAYTRLYINSIRYLFENIYIRKHKQLGNYFKMIPYIHKQCNTLCWNPDSHYSEMQLMNVKHLKEILGYHEYNIKPFIKELLNTKLKNGKSIISFVQTTTDISENYIIFNPYILYGGNFNTEKGIKYFAQFF